MKKKFYINLKKLFKTLCFIVLAIIIKSICQYTFGAEETTMEKIFFCLDFPFYYGCILGSWIMIILQDNWDILFDSGDDNSDNEDVKKSWKGKGKEKITDNSDTTNTVTTNTSSTHLTQEELENINTLLKDKPEHVRAAIINYYIQNNLEGYVGPHQSVDEIDSNPRLLDWYKKAIQDLTKSKVNSLFRIQQLHQTLKTGNDILRSELGNDKPSSNLSNFNINNQDHAAFFVSLLQRQSKISYDFMMHRLMDIKTKLSVLETKDSVKVVEHIVVMRSLQDDFDKIIANIKNIQVSNGDSITSKIWFDKFNHHKKLFSKELNSADELIKKALKKSPFCTLKDSEFKNFKKLNNSFYDQAKEEFQAEESYLKKKISEALHNKKITNKSK